MEDAANKAFQDYPLNFRVASLADAEALVRLINSAFRVELPFIDGDRIDAEGVRSYMAKGKFLVADGTAGLAGCVYVQLHGDRGYLGLLRVAPPRQATGLGRNSMHTAESCSPHPCAPADMPSLRHPPRIPPHAISRGEKLLPPPPPGHAGCFNPKVPRPAVHCLDFELQVTHPRI